MSFSFSQSSIENLKNQIDIVDEIGRSVELKKAGANYKGLCPFHKEKTPSFVVSDTKQYFTCFGCNASGDVIEFVKRFYNLDFAEAVEKLARDHGIELERNSFGEDRSEYYEINRLAARFFYDSFTKKANKGYSYMKSRGIAPATLKKFGIGYADEEWDSLYNYLISKGQDQEKMLELGLISRSKGKCYDRFRGRVMFPIINTSGKVIGFGGRGITADATPKYLNSPESRVFQKKNNLYALNTTRQAAGKEGYMILVEGYMDVISLYQAGVENVAASLGTALTDNQAKLLHRYVKEVVLSYDADAAGQAAALRGIDILRSQDCKVKVLHVADGKDPDEYIGLHGKDEFLKLVKDALPYGDYKLESAKQGFDLDTDEGRLDYMKRAVSLISAMSPIEQDIYKKKLSRDIGVAESAIDREMSQQATAKDSRSTPQKDEDTDAPEKDITALEKTLIKLCVVDEDMIDQVAEHDSLLGEGPSKDIFMAIKNSRDRDGFLDRNKLMDSLQEANAGILAEIEENTVIGADHDRILAECVAAGTREELEKREKEILMKMSMTDDADSDDVIERLSDELMEIQKQLIEIR